MNTIGGHSSSGAGSLDIKAILLKYGNENLNLLNEFSSNSSASDINDRVMNLDGGSIKDSSSLLNKTRKDK